jgi:syntaxin 16
MEEIGVDFFPENYYDIKTDKKAEEEEEKEAKEQRERLIKNVTKVVNAIKILKNKNQKEEKKEEFIPGIITNRFKLFCEYRTNFQKQHFHHLEKDFFDDTKKLIKSSFLFNQNPNQNSLKYDQIELANISTNLNNSNFAESYKKVNNILEDLLGNFSSLKSLQNERIKPKFSDEQNENKRIDNEIKALIKEMMKKIRFCEGLTKMEKNNNFIDESNIENKIINNVKMHLVSKIQNFSNEFRKNEQQFMKYLKEMGSDQEYLENDNKNENKNLNNSFDSSSSDDEKENLNKNFLLTQDDDFELQIRKRDEDINILANSINELSGIFKDLQNVVHEQGTILDRIDYNIEVSYENSHKGLKLLKKAEDHQNESCFRNVILALFLIIFIETLLIIIKIF